MPRVTVLRFTKDYETVVDALTTMVTNAVVTEQEKNGHTVTDIEGDFEHFVLEDMDLWKEHIKIEIQDNHIEGDDDQESRAIIARAIPELADALFSPTIAYVYKRVESVTKTTTIVEKVVDGKVKERDEQTVIGEPVYEWEEITREFGKKLRVE